MNILLPRKFRLAGFILAFIGIVLGVIRFYFDIKLKIFDVKVFAVYSKYFETNYLSIISNHVSEELTALFLITGLFFICFSKEKDETESIQTIRLKSFLLTFYLNTAFILFSFLFIYGFVFINILIINLFCPFIIFFIVFNWLKFRAKQNSKNNLSIG